MCSWKTGKRRTERKGGRERGGGGEEGERRGGGRGDRGGGGRGDRGGGGRRKGRRESGRGERCKQYTISTSGKPHNLQLQLKLECTYSTLHDTESEHTPWRPSLSRYPAAAC